MNLHYCIVSHTHWDREWYLPFEQFRIKLVDLIDNLLDVLRSEPRYRFHLDAQTIIVDDYLEIRPEKEKELSKHIRAGRLFVGPWYVQSDFSLTSAEATIRNLQIGSARARALGACATVGYVPDQFGLMSQLPQVFARAGLQGCVFGRGHVLSGSGKSEFTWRSEDGSEVLCIFLAFWYNNAQRFPDSVEESLKLLEHIKKNSRARAATPHLLLMNGVDHLEAQENLFDVIDALKKRIGKDERIEQVALSEYLQRVRESLASPAVVRGEMRSGPESSVLPGTLSSRVSLKQRNARAQVLLERRLEPLAAVAARLGIHANLHGHIGYLWKLLIANHPHDSICGCSLDAVHRHMEDRFTRLEETGSFLLERLMESCILHLDRTALRDDDYVLVVFNTEPEPRSGCVEAVIEILLSDDRGAIRIIDSEGAEVAYDLLERREISRAVLSPVNLPGVVSAILYKVRLTAQGIPAMGYRAYTVVLHLGALTPATIAEEKGNSAVLDNGDVRVEVRRNGTISFHDHRNGSRFEGLLLLEEREDVGDSYVYRSNPGSSPITNERCVARVEVRHQNTGSACRIAYEMDVPAFYDCAGEKRSSETVRLPVEISLFLPRTGRRLDIDLAFPNTARDHRMRMLFPTGIDSDESWAAMPFDLFRRDRQDVERGDSVASRPNAGFVAVDCEANGLAVLNEGLYEYEHARAGSSIVLTLVRGNSFISRSGSHVPVQENWLVPENQCLGEYRCRIALLSYDGAKARTRAFKERDSFLNPLSALSRPADPRKFMQGRPFVQDASLDFIFFREKYASGVSLPSALGLCSLQGDSIALSSFRTRANSSSVVARLFNLESRAADGVISFSVPVQEAYELSLLDERIERCHLFQETSLRLSFLPKQIRTIEVVLGSAPRRD